MTKYTSFNKMCSVILELSHSIAHYGIPNLLSTISETETKTKTKLNSIEYILDNKPMKQKDCKFISCNLYLRAKGFSSVQIQSIKTTQIWKCHRNRDWNESHQRKKVTFRLNILNDGKLIALLRVRHLASQYLQYFYWLFFFSSFYFKIGWLIASSEFSVLVTELTEKFISQQITRKFEFRNEWFVFFSVEIEIFHFRLVYFVNVFFSLLSSLRPNQLKSCFSKW